MVSRKQTPGKQQVHVERHYMDSLFPFTTWAERELKFFDLSSRTEDQVSPSHGIRDGTRMKFWPCKNSTTMHPWAYEVVLEEEGGR